MLNIICKEMTKERNVYFVHYCLKILQRRPNFPTQLYLINVIFKLESKELKIILLLKRWYLVILLKSGHWVVLLKVTRRRRSWVSSYSKSWGKS